MGFLFVVDTGNHRIVKIDQSTGSFIGWIGDGNSSYITGDLFRFSWNLK